MTTDAKPPQTDRRRRNGALPGGRPDATTSDAMGNRTGRREQTRAGPDAPSAKAVGDTFKV